MHKKFGPNTLSQKFKEVRKAFKLFGEIELQGRQSIQQAIIGCYDIYLHYNEKLIRKRCKKAGISYKLKKPMKMILMLAMRVSDDCGDERIKARIRTYVKNSALSAIAHYNSPYTQGKAVTYIPQMFIAITSAVIAILKKYKNNDLSSKKISSYIASYHLSTLMKKLGWKSNKEYRTTNKTYGRDYYTEKARVELFKKIDEDYESIVRLYNTISSTFSSLNALSDTLQLVKKPVIVTKAVNIENFPKSRIILSR